MRSGAAIDGLKHSDLAGLRSELARGDNLTLGFDRAALSDPLTSSLHFVKKWV